LDGNLKHLVTRKFKNLKDAASDKEIAELLKSSDLLLENNNSFIYVKN
jgi:hypothetical protein